MTEAEILRELMAVAERAGLAVQTVPRGRAIEGGAPVTSAVVRVRGAVRVVLVAGDGLYGALRKIGRWRGASGRRAQ